MGHLFVLFPAPISIAQDPPSARTRHGARTTRAAELRELAKVVVVIGPQAKAVKAMVSCSKSMREPPFFSSPRRRCCGLCCCLREGPRDAGPMGTAGREVQQTGDGEAPDEGRRQRAQPAAWQAAQPRRRGAERLSSRAGPTIAEPTGAEDGGVELRGRRVSPPSRSATRAPTPSRAGRGACGGSETRTVSTRRGRRAARSPPGRRDVRRRPPLCHRICHHMTMLLQQMASPSGTHLGCVVGAFGMSIG